MTNPFFSNTIDLLPATKARAGDVEANLTAVEAGFDEAKQYFDRTLRGTRANPAISEIPDASTRANKALTFDGSGNPVATVTTTEISNAQTYANNAQASATAASGSASAAAGSAASAATLLDAFDDRYLGPKASNPTLDNDGNALLEGALYWNTTVKEMRAYNGTAWVTASVANAVSRGGDTMTGNLNFSGTGLRLTGDFSNATDANRLLFENSVANSVTAVGAKPSGTGAFGALYSVYSTTDTANSVVGQFHAVASGTELRLNSNRTGSASFAPMTFYTGGSERLRIDSSGNVGVGTTSMLYKLVVSNGGASGIEFGPAYSGSANLIQSYNRSGAAYVKQVYDASEHQFNIAGVSRAAIDASGNVGVGVTPSAWNADYRALDIGAAGSFSARVGVSNTIDVVSNAYRNAAGNWIYKATNPASRINLDGSSGSMFFSRAASGTAGNAVTWTDVLTLNSTNDVLVTGSGGLGYGVGSGGTVAQATSKATAVTLNKPSGQIEMSASLLGANATVTFLVNNSLVANSDTPVVAVNNNAAGASARYEAFVSYVAVGLFYITVRNLEATGYSEIVRLNFAIIKGSAS